MPYRSYITEINHRDAIKAQKSPPENNDSGIQFDIDIGMSNTSCFYRLIALVFGMAGIVIGDVLYFFVSSPIRYSLFDNGPGAFTDVLAYRPGLLALYAMRLIGCACILLVFTAICLGCAEVRRILSGELPQQQAGWGYQRKKSHNVVCECLWAVGLVTLVVLIALADWYLFLSPRFWYYIV